jgi:hypothetical protein
VYLFPVSNIIGTYVMVVSDTLCRPWYAVSCWVLVTIPNGWSLWAGPSGTLQAMLCYLAVPKGGQWHGVQLTCPNPEAHVNSLQPHTLADVCSAALQWTSRAFNKNMLLSLQTLGHAMPHI